MVFELELEVGSVVRQFIIDLVVWDLTVDKFYVVEVIGHHQCLISLLLLGVIRLLRLILSLII